MSKSEPPAKRPPLCDSCGVRFVWFEDQGLCGVCGEREAKRPRCSVEGCDTKVLARGLCGLHYQRRRRQQQLQQEQQHEQGEQKNEGQTWRS